MKNVSDKSYRNSQNTNLIFNSNFFSPKIVPFMRYVEKYGRARRTRWQYITCPWHAWQLSLQTHTLLIVNNHYFYMAPMVTPSRLMCVHCQSSVIIHNAPWVNALPKVPACDLKLDVRRSIVESKISFPFFTESLVDLGITQLPIQ